MKKNLALQLYSVRKELQRDYRATFKRVAELGFTGVEFAGFYNIDARAMREALDAYGLQAVGSHTPSAQVENNMDEVIAYNRAIGNRVIGLNFPDLRDEEGLAAARKIIRASLPQVEAAGMEFCYHNHCHEFSKINGRYVLDLLYQEFSPEELRPELDTYWVYRAAEDPVTYCSQYKGRCKLIHLKDGTREGFAPVGCGEIDIAQVLDMAMDMDVDWVILEDESVEPKGLRAVEIGVQNLRNTYHFL